MIESTLGSVIGKAFMKSEGLMTVHATAQKDFFTVVGNRTGRRYYMARDHITWAK